jgi:hypothetical protein
MGIECQDSKRHASRMGSVQRLATEENQRSMQRTMSPSRAEAHGKCLVLLSANG